MRKTTKGVNGDVNRTSDKKIDVEIYEKIEIETGQVITSRNDYVMKMQK